MVAMKRIILAALVGVLVSGPVWGADSKGGYQIYGPGTESCGFWTESRKGAANVSRYHLSAAWVLGFLTASNLLSPGAYDITKGVGNEGLFAWIDNYCSQNPLKSISYAAASLIRHLKTR